MMKKIVGNEVIQAAVFRMLPDMLCRIEIRRVERKPLEVEPGTILDQQSLGCTLTGSGPVDDHRERSASRSQQPLREKLEVFGGEVVVEQVEHKAEATTSRKHRNGGHRSEPIVAIVVLEGRSLAAGSPGPAHRGLEHEGRFVGENDGSSATPGVFFWVPIPLPPRLSLLGIPLARLAFGLLGRLVQPGHQLSHTCRLV